MRTTQLHPRHRLRRFGGDAMSIHMNDDVVFEGTITLGASEGPEEH